MKRKYIHIICITSVAVLLKLSLGQVCAQSKVGTTAVPFLGISIAPRATAMGGAFSAVGDDASSLYYNPGGILGAGQSNVLFAHTDWLVDTNLNWLGLVLNLDGTNALGISFSQLDYGQEPVTTVLAPEGTGAEWGATETALGLTYARNLTDRFSIGGTMKYIQQKIYNETASAFAMDVGLLFITQFNDMRLGMSISNFGTDMRLEGKDLLHRVDIDPDAFGNNETIVSNLKTESWPLPLFFRVGVAMDVIKNDYTRFTVAIDAFRPSDNTEILNVGCEFALNEWVFLRSGYKSLFREDSEEGLTIGAGLKYNFAGSLQGSVDYCYMDFGVLDTVNMLSFSIFF